MSLSLAAILILTLLLALQQWKIILLRDQILLLESERYGDNYE